MPTKPQKPQEKTCPVCSCRFSWTARQQQVFAYNHQYDERRPEPTCSLVCSQRYRRSIENRIRPEYIRGLVERNHLSDEAIADVCGLHKGTVRRLRRIAGLGRTKRGEIYKIPKGDSLA